jgi:hypothetical protein
MGWTDFLRLLWEEKNFEEPTLLYPVGSPRLSFGQIAAYEESNAPLTKRLVSELESLVWLKVYSRMPIEQRREVMQKVVDLFAKIFSFHSAQVFVKTNRRPISWYGQGSILLDSRMIASVRLAAETVLHEASHNYQKAVVNRLKRKELPPQDPLYPIAEVWLYNFNHYLSPAPGKISLYERQPLEFFANRFARGMLAVVSYLEAASEMEGEQEAPQGEWSPEA